MKENNLRNIYARKMQVVFSGVLIGTFFWLLLSTAWPIADAADLIGSSIFLMLSLPICIFIGMMITSYIFFHYKNQLIGFWNRIFTKHMRKRWLLFALLLIVAASTILVLQWLELRARY